VENLNVYELDALLKLWVNGYLADNLIRAQRLMQIVAALTARLETHALESDEGNK